MIAMVYPYNRQFTPFLRYGRLSKFYDEIRLVAPAGWGMTGKDAGRADNGIHIGLTVKSDFQNELINCDTVIFCDYSLPLDFEKHIYTKVIQSICQKKNIVYLLPIDSDSEQKFRTLCRYDGVTFTCFRNEYSKNFLEDCKNEPPFTIKTIDVPVIFVLGVGERTNKFDIQLALRNYYLENGYKVSQVGTRSYCEWAGFHSFPDFMINKSLSETQKVVYFNNFIKSIEKAEKPDVFIIGVPGGIISLSEIFYQDFGMLAYQVSCAVKPDICVLSLYYDKYKQDLLEYVNTSVSYRFGLEVDYLNVANVKIDMPISIEKRKLNYLSIDTYRCEEIKAILNTPDKPIFNILNTEDAKKLSDFTKSKLEEYSEISLVNEI